MHGMSLQAMNAVAHSPHYIARFSNVTKLWRYTKRLREYF